MGTVVLSELHAFELDREVYLKLSPLEQKGVMNFMRNIPLISCTKAAFLTKIKKALPCSGSACDGRETI